MKKEYNEAKLVITLFSDVITASGDGGEGGSGGVDPGD